MGKRSQKILITRRIWQLLAAMAFVSLTLLSDLYPFSVPYGIGLGGGIFLIVFSLTYWREERRATHSPHSNLVINWNLAEAVLLLASLIGYFVFAYLQDFDRIFFYAFFRTGTLGLLGGVAIGEVFWRQTRLRTLDETCRQRYWAGYKNSILG